MTQAGDVVVSREDAPLPPGARAVEERFGLDPVTFDREVKGRFQPVAIRGLAADWPAVRAAQAGPVALADYLRRLDGGSPATVFVAAPEVRGRYFYADDMRGLNFRTEQMRVAMLLDRLLAQQDAAAPQGLYAGSVPTAESLRAFAAENRMPLDTGGGEPRIWIGNASRIATHYDMSANLAVAVAGRRRVTLFPPEQIANLYVGPVERTVAGQPTSMVDPLAPDLARYPKFAEAQRHARIADLAPGDALFIPPMWWHHVKATAPINVLVNYWSAEPAGRAPFAVLMHAILAIRDLPEPERAAWRAWFDHLVFGPEAPLASEHLPPHAKGVLGPPSRNRDEIIRNFVIGHLSR